MPSFRLLLIAAFASLFVAAVGATGPQLLGADAMLRPDLLPLIRDGVETRQFCSYDRAGDNYDWQYFPLYVESNGECVIFDAMGPGCLYRHHMNIWHGGTFGPNGFVPEPLEKDIRIRYYFDNEKTPRIDMDVSTFFSEKNPLGIFKEPLAYDGKDRFRLLYHPMFFKKRLKVALSRVPGGDDSSPLPWLGRYSEVPKTRYAWYSYTYQLYREDPGLPSWTSKAGLRAMPALEKAWSSPGVDPRPEKGSLTAGRRVTLEPEETDSVLRLKGPRTISALKLRIADGSSPAAMFGTWVKVTFDGAKEPQIYAPIGSFFGGYRTSAGTPYRSLFLGYAADEGYCYLPMPFWRSALVEIENRSSAPVTIQAQAEHKPLDLRVFSQERTGYLYAAYRREDPRTEGRDYTYLDVAGAGHVVGHVSSRWGTSMEEDERTYFDGNRSPKIHGDGFEDDHGMGWGLQNLVRPVFGAFAARDGEGGIYRWYVPELYSFSNGVKHGHQTYGPNSPRGHEGLYGVGSEESVTFYYAQPSPRTVLTDEVNVGDTASESAHRYRARGDVKRVRGEYWYDGERNNVLMPTPSITDDGISLTRSCEFEVAIDPENQGMRLRRRTDKENNRQRAKVYIDDQLVAERPWYSVDFEQTYRNIRWLDSDFDVPAKYTLGKSRVRVRIQFESSETGRWDEYRYWAFSYVKPSIEP